ncbi:MAG: hypothetical protein ABJZ69_10215 [Hyphomicrobiales bacterium]
MPNISDVVPIFCDQDKPCGAFDAENMKRQMEFAASNSTPPWAKKRKRRKASKPMLEKLDVSTEPMQWTKEESTFLWRTYGVPLQKPLRFAINLCHDGTVVTKDGEFLGRWEMDENIQPMFFPDGDEEPLFSRPLIGFLCDDIKNWHEARGRSEAKMI